MRDPRDRLPFEFSGKEQVGEQKDGHEVSVLLIHDGVTTKVNDPNVKIFALRDDIEARGIQSDYETIDYAAMADMIFEAKTVINW